VVTTPALAGILASADTYVSENNPGNNYGIATSLRSDRDPIRRPYFTFQVTGTQANVTRARLRIFATTKSTTAISVRQVIPTTWGERTITWTNAPPPGVVVGTHPAFASPGWISIDVTPLVTGNGPVSLLVDTTSSTSSAYASRETTTPPRLLVDSAP
jgi:hypothetical protein